MVYCICAFALYYNYIYKLWSRGAYKVRRTFRASFGKQFERGIHFCS